MRVFLIKSPKFIGFLSVVEFTPTCQPPPWPALPGGAFLWANFKGTLREHHLRKRGKTNQGPPPTYCVL